MKKLLLIGLFLLFSLPSFSQALENSSFYKSDITIYSGGSKKAYTHYFYVNGYGEVRQINFSDNTYMSFDTYKTLSNSQSTVYTWGNSGGIWSETQTFVFTKNKTNGDIRVMSMRVVQNESEEPWQTYGLGDVYKY